MFALFRFDLPIAVTEQLVAQLDQMEASPLTDEELKRLADYQNELAKVQKLPKIRQGVAENGGVRLWQRFGAGEIAQRSGKFAPFLSSLEFAVGNFIASICRVDQISRF